MHPASERTFKAELIGLHGPWRSRRDLEIAIIQWIDWYNHRRLHSEIGDIPPAEHEQIWYRQQDLAHAAAKPIIRTALNPEHFKRQVQTVAYVARQTTFERTTRFELATLTLAR